MDDYSKTQKAIIKLPDGKIVKGPCVNFKTDDNGNCIATLKGIGAFCTHMSNIAIIYDPESKIMKGDENNG